MCTDRCSKVDRNDQNTNLGRSAQKETDAMNRSNASFPRLTASLAIAATSAFAASSHAQLVDPGFETSTPLLTAAATLSNFVVSQGQWGQENSTVVGVTGLISPFAGVGQLKMDVTGGVTTQAFQAFDVSSYAASINSNTASINAGAYYNSEVSAAIAGVYVSFYNTPDTSSPTGPSALSVFTLDNLSATWELNQFTAPIPAGTTWILYQVAYAESSLFDATGVIGSGFVDETFARIIVPAPSTAGLLGLGACCMLRRRRGLSAR
jgi:hypothetical protein